MKHTKGPWHIVLCPDKDSRGHNRYEVRQVGSLTCITGWGNVNQLEADARLIAAAPDLLAALSEIVCPYCYDMIGLPPSVHQPCVFCEQARAAIAAATGEADGSG